MKKQYFTTNRGNRYYVRRARPLGPSAPRGMLASLLGGGLGGGVVEGVATLAGGNAAIEEAADEAYNVAVDMCGNEGQVSIIDMTGYDAFVSAATEAWNNGDPLGALTSACPHPDAVSEILEEAADLMIEMIEEFKDPDPMDIEYHEDSG